MTTSALASDPARLILTTDDPVLAALRRAPCVSPQERERVLALRAEVTSDPRTWQTTEELMAKLAALRA